MPRIATIEDEGRTCVLCSGAIWIRDVPAPSLGPRQSLREARCSCPITMGSGRPRVED